MTVSVISDLHCHGKPRDLPPSFDAGALQPADVLVVAGDIATRDSRDVFCKKLMDVADGKFGETVIVYGNHDFYTTDYEHIVNDVVKPSVSDNFVKSIAEKAEGKPDRIVDFICTPMWSPIKHGELISRCINDYNYIPEFTTQRCTELFFENLEWLEKNVAKSKEAGHDVIIVTHHLPRHELVDLKFADSEVNEAFCVINAEAEKRIAELAPLLWIHGHSHNFMDETIDGVRYVRNPYGYEYGFRREFTGYKHNFIVTV